MKKKIVVRQVLEFERELLIDVPDGTDIEQVIEDALSGDVGLDKKSIYDAGWGGWSLVGDNHEIVSEENL